MSDRLTVRKFVAAVAAAVLVGAAWQATAQQPDTASNRAPSEQGQQDQMMHCPMMSAMEDLKLHANSPAVLLAMQGQLNLSDQQRERLEKLTSEVRTQASKILTDQQQQQLAKAPQGPLSVMQVATLLRQGPGIEQPGEMCPMCMQMMRKRMQQSKEGQDSSEDAEQLEEERGR